MLRYGRTWEDTKDSELAAEFYAIQRGGRWVEGGRQFGDGLLEHYRRAHFAAWADWKSHRWFDLMLKSFVEEEITVIMGSKDCGKTYGMSAFALLDYWAFPDNTLWLISSTEYRGCQLRIWGDVKDLFNEAKERFPWLSGHPLESMHSITTDEIDDDQELARSLKRGMILVPCKKGNQMLGLSAFQGVKSPRLRHAGDEVPCMAEGFLNAYANWYGKRDFKGMMAGNPTDPEDNLCRAAEPIDGGWDNFVDTGKTQTWRSKFFNAFAIALDGRDSPNDDFPASDKPMFHFLISKKGRDGVAQSFGMDSWQWYSQITGKPNRSVLLWRVITKNQCEANRAMEEVIWFGESLTSIYAIDPNYGGADRCVGGKIDFGKDVEGNNVIAFYPPEVFPVKPVIRKFDPEPEEQIAGIAKARLDSLDIPVENCFYDPGGKGTLGFSFAKVFGNNCPIPVDFGARPTDRPVRHDLFVEDKNASGGRRLKRCNEHYKKFVSELWFSVAEAILSQQVRQLPPDVMRELCLRTYSNKNEGNKIEIEPKSGTPHKPGFIERIGYSPDLGDWSAIAIEGARRRGFKIKRLGPANSEGSEENRNDWLDKWSQERLKLRRSKELSYAH